MGKKTSNFFCKLKNFGTKFDSSRDKLKILYSYD